MSHQMSQRHYYATPCHRIDHLADHASHENQECSHNLRSACSSFRQSASSKFHSNFRSVAISVQGGTREETVCGSANQVSRRVGDSMQEARCVGAYGGLGGLGGLGGGGLGGLHKDSSVSAPQLAFSSGAVMQQASKLCGHQACCTCHDCYVLQK